MSASAPASERRVLVRGGLLGFAAALLVQPLLVVLFALVLQIARGALGEDASVALSITLALVGFAVSGAAGASVGAWQAVRAGAAARAEVIRAAVTGPAALCLLVLVLPGADGYDPAASLREAAALAAGTTLAVAWLRRRIVE